MSRPLEFRLEFPTDNDTENQGATRRGKMSRHNSRKTRGRRPWPSWLPPRPNRPELVPTRCDRKELMRGPQRVSLLAVTELRNPKNRDIVLWIVGRVDSNAGLNPTALIREVGPKSEIAVQVLRRVEAGGPGWVEWAEANARPGNAHVAPGTGQKGLLRAVVETYREIEGNASNSGQLLAS